VPWRPHVTTNLRARCHQTQRPIQVAAERPAMEPCGRPMLVCHHSLLANCAGSLATSPLDCWVIATKCATTCVQHHRSRVADLSCTKAFDAEALSARSTGPASSRSDKKHPGRSVIFLVFFLNVSFFLELLPGILSQYQKQCGSTFFLSQSILNFSKWTEHVLCVNYSGLWISRCFLYSPTATNGCLIYELKLGSSNPAKNTEYDVPSVSL
jgi:hypothetical protein